jgi:hypothetical protein
MSRTKKNISWVSVFEIIVIVLLVLMIGFMLACNLLIRSNGGAAPFFGLTFYKTNAVNMIPKIPANTVIIAKASEKANIDKNQVILCKLGENTTLIRVVKIDRGEDGRMFYDVRFDTSPETDAFRISEDDVIAKAMWQLTTFGKFVDFATSTVGIILSVIIPLLMIIAFQVVRIANIRKLEEEASSLDDIDELIVSRDAEAEEAPMTFTEPKFLEDVTDKFKIPPPEPYEPIVPEVLPGQHHAKTWRGKEKKPESSMSINPRGRAEYNATAAEKPAQPEEPLFTYDRLPKKTVMSATGTIELKREELYLNKPTKAEPAPPKSKVDEFFETYSPSRGMKNATREERVVFTPHLSNVVPDKLLNIQAESAAPKQTGFDESIRAYYEKSEPVEKKTYAAPMPRPEPPHKAKTIPEMAVVPRETLAPPVKKKSNRTVDELMSLINSEEDKLKK